MGMLPMTQPPTLRAPPRSALATPAAGGSAEDIKADQKRLLWGDTHLHTTYSSDAFINGNLTATPDTAYRYAKGIPVEHPGHKARVQIGTPLDFLVVSDHAEYLGVIRSLYLNPMVTEGLGWRDRFWTRFVQYLPSKQERADGSEKGAYFECEIYHFPSFLLYENLQVFLFHHLQL